MNQTYDWTEDMLDTINDLTVDALLLELCLFCRDEHPSRLSRFPVEVWDSLLLRAISYTSQHTLDLRVLSRYLERV